MEFNPDGKLDTSQVLDLRMQYSTAGTAALEELREGALHDYEGQVAKVKSTAEALRTGATVTAAQDAAQAVLDLRPLELRLETVMGPAGVSDAQFNRKFAAVSDAEQAVTSLVRTVLDPSTSDEASDAFNDLASIGRPMPPAYTKHQLRLIQTVQHDQADNLRRAEQALDKDGGNENVGRRQLETFTINAAMFATGLNAMVSRDLDGMLHHEDFALAHQLHLRDFVEPTLTATPPARLNQSAEPKRRTIERRSGI